MDVKQIERAITAGFGDDEASLTAYYIRAKISIEMIRVQAKIRNVVADGNIYSENIATTIAELQSYLAELQKQLDDLELK